MACSVLPLGKLDEHLRDRTEVDDASHGARERVGGLRAGRFETDPFGPDRELDVSARRVVSALGDQDGVIEPNASVTSVTASMRLETPRKSATKLVSGSS